MLSRSMRRSFRQKFESYPELFKIPKTSNTGADQEFVHAKLVDVGAIQEFVQLINEF